MVRLAKLIMTEDVYVKKVDAAFQHAGAASRQQELESIKLAASLGVYTKEELKQMMDKHLKKTFYLNASYEKVIDLTSDEETEVSPAKSGMITMEILTQTTPDTFQTPNNSGDSSSSTQQSNGRKDGVAKELFQKDEANIAAEKKEMQKDVDSMTILGDQAFAAAKRSIAHQPTLTQGGMGWLLPSGGGNRTSFPVIPNHGTNEGMLLLDNPICCALEYCVKPVVKSSMQCSLCRGSVHLDCVFSKGDYTIACGKCKYAFVCI